MDIERIHLPAELSLGTAYNSGCLEHLAAACCSQICILLDGAGPQHRLMQLMVRLPCPRQAALHDPGPYMAKACQQGSSTGSW